MSKNQPEDDDVDEFLYGSAKEEATTGSNKAPAGQPADVDAKDTKGRTDHTASSAKCPC